MGSGTTVTVTVSGIPASPGIAAVSTDEVGGAPPPPLEGAESAVGAAEEMAGAPMPPSIAGSDGTAEAVSEGEAPPPPMGGDGDALGLPASVEAGDEGPPPPPEAEAEADFSVTDLDDGPPPLEDEAGAPSIEGELPPPVAEVDSEPAAERTGGASKAGRKRKK